MALSISPEKGLFVKKTVYVDMDGEPVAGQDLGSL